MTQKRSAANVRRKPGRPGSSEPGIFVATVRASLVSEPQLPTNFQALHFLLGLSINTCPDLIQVISLRRPIILSAIRFFRVVLSEICSSTVDLPRKMDFRVSADISMHNPGPEGVQMKPIHGMIYCAECCTFPHVKSANPSIPAVISTLNERHLQLDKISASHMILES